MLSTKITHIFTTNHRNSNIRCRPLISHRYFSIKWIDILNKNTLNINVMTMSNVNFRVLVRDLVISKLCNAWARSFVVNSMTKRCRRDRTVRDVWHRFRQTVLRPKHALLFTTVSAAYKNNEEKPGMPVHCSKDISDAEMQALIADIESMEELAKATLFCVGCARRIVIDSRHSGVRYCNCENAQPPVRSYDGWEPYMEAEDVIIWRKEYKPGGLYAYKVYGRYKHIKAEDFAAIQVDGAYRKVWDSAVASLSVVERTANGMVGQDVLHWEVLWPRLFANRDYVYIRRHKEYALKDSCMAHKEAIFEDESCGPITGAVPVPVAAENLCEYQCERECVHSPAKRKSQEAERKFLEAERKYQEAERKSQEAERKYQEAERKTQEAERKFLEAERKSQEAVGKLDPAQRQRSQAQAKASEEAKRPNQPNEDENRVYVIVSRSCKHPQVPSMGSAIRVSEYWSHMVIKTLNGPNKNGMEFVLTYYDEPAVGGLPTAVMSWAMGRAGPAFLDRMRKAAMEYRAWKKKAQDEETPDFTPNPTKVSFDNKELPYCEQDMETSKEGPELNDDKNNSASKEANIASEKNNLTSKTEHGKEDMREAAVVLVEDIKDGSAVSPELRKQSVSPEFSNTAKSPEISIMPTSVPVGNTSTSSKDVDEPTRDEKPLSEKNSSLLVTKKTDGTLSKPIVVDLERDSENAGEGERETEATEEESERAAWWRKCFDDSDWFF